MNDSVNTPERVYDYLSKNFLSPVIMKPEEKQFISQLEIEQLLDRQQLNKTNLHLNSGKINSSLTIKIKASIYTKKITN